MKGNEHCTGLTPFTVGRERRGAHVGRRRRNGRGQGIPLVQIPLERRPLDRSQPAIEDHDLGDITGKMEHINAQVAGRLGKCGRIVGGGVLQLAVKPRPPIVAL